MRITIDQKGGVTVRCECTAMAIVADLEAAVHWAFLEGLRHGRGCHIDINVDMTLHVENLHAAGQPSHPG
jgi:hypothetical protein